MLSKVWSFISNSPLIFPISIISIISYVFSFLFILFNNLLRNSLFCKFAFFFYFFCWFSVQYSRFSNHWKTFLLCFFSICAFFVVLVLLFGLYLKKKEEKFAVIATVVYTFSPLSCYPGATLFRFDLIRLIIRHRCPSDCCHQIGPYCRLCQLRVHEICPFIEFLMLTVGRIMSW